MSEISQRLLDWYDVHGRTLPWRVRGRRRPDPYRVWLSEIMLQQTTVAAVVPYFEKFVAAWPTVAALARTELDAVLTAWAGLGYYSRARNLHACARLVVERHDGAFPRDVAALRALPGIGPYTAAAIAAIAFDARAAPVDGNVERVMARLHAVTIPLPKAKKRLTALAEACLPEARFGDHAQAMMDLGATVCTPRQPKCPVCPFADLCRARSRGLAAQLPKKAAKKPRPTRRGAAFWVEGAGGTVLLRRRPERGLLGGMMEIPSTPWDEDPSDPLAHAPVSADWVKRDGQVRHVFTHFALELDVYTARIRRRPKLGADFRWAPVDGLDRVALPSVMRKVVRLAQQAE